MHWSVCLMCGYVLPRRAGGDAVYGPVGGRIAQLRQLRVHRFPGPRPEDVVVQAVGEGLEGGRHCLGSGSGSGPFSRSFGR